MKASLDLVTEVKELLRRASSVLANFESFEDADAKNNVVVEAAYWLLKAYVMGHEVAAKSPHYESWLEAVSYMVVLRFQHGPTRRTNR